MTCDSVRFHKRAANSTRKARESALIEILEVIGASGSRRSCCLCFYLAQSSFKAEGVPAPGASLPLIKGNASVLCGAEVMALRLEFCNHLHTTHQTCCCKWVGSGRQSCGKWRAWVSDGDVDGSDPSAEACCCFAVFLHTSRNNMH